MMDSTGMVKSRSHKVVRLLFVGVTEGAVPDQTAQVSMDSLKSPMNGVSEAVFGVQVSLPKSKRTLKSLTMR